MQSNNNGKNTFQRKQNKMGCMTSYCDQCHTEDGDTTIYNSPDHMPMNLFMRSDKDDLNYLHSKEFISE